MSAAMELCGRLEGAWAGEGQVSPSPWAKGGPVAVQAEVRRLRPATTVVLRYAHRQEGEAPFESETVLALADPARAWVFDTMGFVPDAPGTVAMDGAALVVERRSPRGSNATRYALDAETGTLAIAVTFTPQGADGAAMTIATATLRPLSR